MRYFPGATTDDGMKSYVISTIKQKPEAIVIHCGSNKSHAQRIFSLWEEVHFLKIALGTRLGADDLKTTQDHVKIGDNIQELAYQCKKRLRWQFLKLCPETRSSKSIKSSEKHTVRETLDSQIKKIQTQDVTAIELNCT